MSSSPQLQKWQRNQIFEAIEGVGLDPREFDLKDAEAEVRNGLSFIAKLFQGSAS
jgi:hypothetical protein